MSKILCAGCMILLTLTLPVRADLVTTNVTGDVFADFDGVTDSAMSSANADVIGAFVTAENSFTDADLSWAFDSGTQTLTGSGLVITEKTVSPKPGGAHLGSNSLVFEIEIDGDVDFFLDGTFGFSAPLNGTNDSILYALTGPGGTVVAGSTTSTAGIASDSFSHMGVLLNNSGTGTTVYTLTISSDLAETINNQGTVSAGWALTQFRIVSSPEPSALWLLGLPAVGLVAYRDKRRRESAIPASAAR